MARSIQEVINEIISAENTEGLAPLSTPSATAIRKLWRRIVASVIVTLEQMWDWFRAEITTIIEARRPHTTRWYRRMALVFQFGQSLPEDQIQYDNTGMTDSEVANKMIIKQAAAVERNNLLIVKVATEVNGVLVPLDSIQIAAFENYMNEVKDAGVPMVVQSYAPDLLKLEIDIYYDPSVMGHTGTLLDGTDDTPVQKAINTYLRNLEFNGVFIKTKLIDSIQQVQGVIAPECKSVTVARWDDASNFQGIEVFHEPYSGYYNLNDLTLNFIAHE